MNSPEPWSVVGKYMIDNPCPDEPWGIVSADGHLIHNARYGGNWEDMDRVVACVNFCRQFPTKFLECRQAVNLPDVSDVMIASQTLADVPRFVGLIAVQRNE